MDTIFLHGLNVNTLIGIYEWERQQPQSLVLDIDICTDFFQAAQSDNIDDTIHYGQVAEDIRSTLAEQSFLLLEALAEYVAQFILMRYQAFSVTVKVVKPGILAGVNEVGVIIERQRVTEKKRTEASSRKEGNDEYCIDSCPDEGMGRTTESKWS